MRRTIIVAVAVLAVAVAVAASHLVWWQAGLALAAATALAARIGRCAHDGPLALLSATKDMTGRALPARWYCDECGRTWPASFRRPGDYLSSSPLSSSGAPEPCGQSSAEAGSSSQRC